MARPKNPEPESDAKAEPIPESFPPNQLFVCVSDNDGAASGFDGGPEVGGSGAWARGAVRQWTASHAVPLALRNPENGLISKGYLEPVLTLEHGPQGKPIVTSQKYFATRHKSGAWAAAAPSKDAVARANRGASSVTKALSPFGGATLPAQQRAMDAGLVVAG